ncbi:DNA polymerase III subunit epsilon [Corynebacterium riegelii]|uniref:DNA polymerase III subunit epsilon n=1 Tax=Corynebacterium riegelii TaxID=156976 RepID=UPI00191F5948|nr:DNA polymerase III subunit epsilon [Corynebacterium riegelii]QQU84652.1 DNA polymerase III subunit epsilon [Corynebacterium riegelii]
MTYPYVALSVRANGIHPSNARLLTIDAVTFDAAGRIGEEFHQVLNPGTDPGPRHTHGLEVGDFAQAPRFARQLRTLDKLIDAKTLVLYDSPLDWGMIVSEAKRAMNAAARANRSRRGRGNKHRQRVGHVPKPEAIVDVLATVRRQGHIPVDARLEHVAELIGVVPVSGDARVRTLIAMFLALKEAGEVVSLNPADLAGDRFGLQRSQVRVDAAKAGNSSRAAGHTQTANARNAERVVYTPAEGLQRGMEFVVTDDVTVNPDVLIAAGVDAGLKYAEKLTRQTSVVVSEALAKGVELRGKAMHAFRKDVPILTASEFEAAVQTMADNSAGAGE